MLNIEAVNHVGIRVGNKQLSIAFYAFLGFRLIQDAGFEKGHPVVMTHPSGVTINLLGPASVNDAKNILMDVAEKYPGIPHVAFPVSSLDEAQAFLNTQGIEITGSFSFGNMSADIIRAPDRNVIELDAYGDSRSENLEGYSNHPH